LGLERGFSSFDHASLSYGEASGRRISWTSRSRSSKPVRFFEDVASGLLSSFVGVSFRPRLRTLRVPHELSVEPCSWRTSWIPYPHGSTSGSGRFASFLRPLLGAEATTREILASREGIRFVPSLPLLHLPIVWWCAKRLRTPFDGSEGCFSFPLRFPSFFTTAYPRKASMVERRSSLDRVASSVAGFSFRIGKTRELLCLVGVVVCPCLLVP
jgi:hypothetical protein